ncbi:MAG: cytochrome c3 family protein, partial [Comamonadaceae bacterium]
MINTTRLDAVFRQCCALALMLLCLSAMLGSSGVRAQTAGGFDHAATAFPLMGAHEQVRCESCHIKGIFKSTPRDCVGCHVVNNQRGATAMPYRHIQIAGSCDSCHNVSSFGAVMFSHSAVQPGTCGTCHDGYRATGQSAKHISTNLSCDVCHSSVSFLPVQRFAHSALGGDTTTCATCHDGRSATGMPINHLPRSNPALCASCHVQSVLTDFTSFSGGQMNHSGITSGCADCHGPSITGGTFAGISSIVVMPPTSPVGPSSHIPSSIACESCHIASLPPGLVAGNASRTAPGSGFATPAPTTTQIHTGITGNCSACHDTNFVWMGMSAYPIAPSTLTTGAQYTGFQTRPKSTAGTYSVADAAHPSAGDCSQCHNGTNYFVGEIKPANHIPTLATAQCTACHTSTDYAVMPTLANIHANAPSTTANCAQCHAANVVAGFAIPAANFVIVGPPANHIPSSAACETCHVGAGSSVASLPVGNGAKFSNSLMSHTGITNNCESCHGASITGASFAGISKIVVMPPTSPVGASAHIPSSTTCENCHLATTPTGLVAASATKTAPGTAFATPAPTTTQIHTGITGNCSACHDTNFVWMGMSAYPIAPSTLTTGAQYTGFQTRPKSTAGTYSVADAAHPSAGDCSQCHSGTNYFTGQDKPGNHIPTSSTAQCTACHTSTDYSVMPTLANIHANAPSTTNNCAQCHGSAAASFAIPAANFSIVGLPGNHIPSSGACETCHVGAGSSVASLPVGNGAKFSNSLMSHTGITNNCESCHGASITGASFAGISKIVVMPPTSPVGPNAHIPSTTSCETCHLGSTPTGMVAASSSKTAPGTAFATPAPTTTQIHTGITGNCSACHDTNFVWMGMSAYPIAPT